MAKSVAERQKELKNAEIECTDILAEEKIRQALLSDDS